MPEFNAGLIPSRSPLPAILIAAGVLVAIAAAVLYFNPRKTADLSITRVQTYTAHTETKPYKGGIHIIGAPARIEDDLYVLVNVKLTDKLRLPLFIKDETAVLTAPDHSITEVSALQRDEITNVYASFPAVQALASAALSRDTQTAPGQTSEGLILLHFPGATDKDWTTRKSCTLTIQFFHQAPETLTVP